MNPTIYGPYLWILTVLLVGRVVGQLIVARWAPRWLPPMEQWQSGLMPYPALLVAQCIILVTFGIVCTQFTRRRGYFVDRGGWLGTPLWTAGWIYAAAMLVRYALWMTIRPDERWTGDLIPVTFHLVLASFLVVVAHHHRPVRP